MKTSQKGLLIGSIINYLRDNVAAKNKKLTDSNLYAEQEKFDESGIFLKLAFMADEDVKKIASEILI